MSNERTYLVNESPLIVLPSLATIVGLNAALVIQQIHFWLNHNERVGKEDTHYFDEKWWCYNTYRWWRERNFPFWSDSTIERIFAGLKQRDLIECRASSEANYKGNWVTINYPALDELMQKCAQKPLAPRQNEEGVQAPPRQNDVPPTSKTGDIQIPPDNTPSYNRFPPMAEAGAPSAGGIQTAIKGAGNVLKAVVNKEKKKKPGQSEDLHMRPFVVRLIDAFERSMLTPEEMKRLRKTCYFYDGGDAVSMKTYAVDMYEDEPGFELFVDETLPRLLQTDMTMENVIGFFNCLQASDEEDRKVHHWWYWRQMNAPTVESEGIEPILAEPAGVLEQPIFEVPPPDENIWGGMPLPAAPMPLPVSVGLPYEEPYEPFDDIARLIQHDGVTGKG
jgi:hypothetical protein